MFYKFSSDFSYEEKDWKFVLDLESMIMSVFMEYSQEVTSFEELVHLTKKNMSESGSRMSLQFFNLYFEKEQSSLEAFIHNKAPRDLEVDREKLRHCLEVSSEFCKSLQR